MEYSITDLIRAVKIEAKRKADTAAYSGAMHDGGSGFLLNQVRFYEMGLKGEIPEEWLRYEKHINPEEYQEYLKLKNKYRG